MRVVSVFAMASVLALSVEASAARPKKAETATPRLRTIEIDPQKAKAVYKVKTAPGLATVIQLPEGWAVRPTCGDCVFGDAEEKGQMFRLDVSEPLHTISIKPTRLPSVDVPASAFLTNIDVALKGGVSVTLFVEMALPEEADARVELVLPKEAMLEARQAVALKKLEEDFARRVDAAANERVLDALVAGTVCRDFFGRPNRSDGVVVRLVQLCKNGRFVYVVFDVENRNASEMALLPPSLTSKEGAGAGVGRVTADRLLFNQETRGIAAIAIDGAGVKPSSYVLTVSEDGGEGRVVAVDGIAF